MLISHTIDSALTHLGVKNPIEEATPQDHEFGLKTLNRIIDAYNTQNLIVTYLEDITYEAPSIINECETAVPEDLEAKEWGASVTIGHCKQINDTAPIDIQGLFWRQSGTDYPSKAMTSNSWQDIGWKTASGIPARHYIQRTDDNNIKIYFDLVPLYNVELHLMAKRPYTGKNSVGNEYLPTDDINWNFGFEKALMLRLAIELAPSYSVEPNQMLLALAQEAENNLKAHNYTPAIQKGADGLTGGRHRNSSSLNRARF